MSSGPSVDVFAEPHLEQVNILDISSLLDASKKLSRALEDQKELQNATTVSKLISRLIGNGILLLTHETRDLRLKIIGLCILDSIIDVSDWDVEAASKKKEITRACYHIMENNKMLLETEYVPITIRLLAICVGEHFYI